MNIVDITEFYSERGGGIRSHLTSRGESLGRSDHCHTLIAPGPRDEDGRTAGGDRRRKGRSSVVRVAGPVLPYDRTYHLLHRFGAVRAIVQSERPDVLEAHSPYLATAAVLASGRRVARLTTAFWHSDHLGVYAESSLRPCFGESFASAIVKPLWYGVRLLLSPFDAVFVAGRRQAERLRAANVPRVVHAAFGVDTSVFRPSARDQRVRDAWIGEGDRSTAVLIGAGRFAVEKRWDVVIEAFARLRARRKAVLVLYGDGPEREALERSAPHGVIFAGFEKDRHRFAAALASADALVHAGPYETFGLSIAEAVACATPVVVPDAGGAAEHAAAGCGRLYPSLDPEACAAAIEAVLSAPRSDVRAAALDAASRARTIEQHCRFVVGAYDDLLRDLRR